MKSVTTILLCLAAMLCGGCKTAPKQVVAPQPVIVRPLPISVEPSAVTIFEGITPKTVLMPPSTNTNRVTMATVAVIRIAPKPPVTNQTLRLDWMPSTTANTDGYKVFWGTASNMLTLAKLVNGLTATFSNLPLTRLYFAVCAADSFGNQSDFARVSFSAWGRLVTVNIGTNISFTADDLAQANWTPVTSQVLVLTNPPLPMMHWRGVTNGGNLTINEKSIPLP